jgi:hypothetical protein
MRCPEHAEERVLSRSKGPVLQPVNFSKNCGAQGAARAINPLYNYRARCAPGLPMAQHFFAGSAFPIGWRGRNFSFAGAFSKLRALHKVTRAAQRECPSTR